MKHASDTTMKIPALGRKNAAGCASFGERISAYMDGEVLATEAALISQHLDECGPCRRFREAVVACHAPLRQALTNAPGPVHLDDAIAAIQAKLAYKSRPSWLQRMREAWDDAWSFQRPRMQSLVLAMALGALLAPALFYWFGGAFQPAPSLEIPELAEQSPQKAPARSQQRTADPKPEQHQMLRKVRFNPGR